MKCPKYNDETIQLVAMAKCQNAEPIKINGGSNSVFYWIACYSYEVHTKCDWSLKISSLFHWFFIPQTNYWQARATQINANYCFDCIR